MLSTAVFQPTALTSSNLGIDALNWFPFLIPWGILLLPSDATKPVDSGWAPVEIVSMGRITETPSALDDPFYGIQTPGGLPERLQAEPTRPLPVLPVAPRKFFSLVLAPVFEANQLLPEKLDPFTDRSGQHQVASDSPANGAPGFNPSAQAALLGSRLAVRTDTPEDKAAWQWQAQAGGTFRQGSSSNTNMSAQFLTERHSIRSDFVAKMGAVYNDNGGQDQNRRWYGEGLYDRNLRGRWIAYGRNEIEYDEARKIRVRDVFSAGLGFRFIDRLTQRWVARTGPTYTYVDYAASANLDDQFQSGWLLESDYRKIVAEGIRFGWTATAYPDFINNDTLRVRNEASLMFPIGGVQSNWNWKIGAWHEYQTHPAAGAQANDFEAVFSIVYTNTRGR